MDVVDPWPDLVWVRAGRKRIQQFHLRTGSLNADHIRIHIGDILKDIIKLGVTHVRVYLRLVFNA